MYNCPINHKFVRPSFIIITESCILENLICHPLLNLDDVPDVVVGACVLDLVALRGLHPLLCRLLCCWSRLHPLDDHGGALLAGAQARRHVGRSLDQLVRQLSSRHWLPYYAGILEVVFFRWQILAKILVRVLTFAFPFHKGGQNKLQKLNFTNGKF